MELRISHDVHGFGWILGLDGHAYVDVSASPLRIWVKAWRATAGSVARDSMLVYHITKWL